MQITIAIVSWCVMLLASPFAKPISEQLADLPEETHHNLIKTIEHHISTQELKEKDEEKIMEETILLHNSLHWDCPKKAEFYPRISQEGIIPVDMKWSCSGDLLSLPVFIEGLSRLSSRGILQSVHIDFPNKEMSFHLRFLRAKPNCPDWIDSREDISEKEKALLRQGWLMMYWKAFRRLEKERERERNKDLFMIELSRTLTQYRNTKALIDWSLRKGFTKRNL